MTTTMTLIAADGFAVPTAVNALRADLLGDGMD